MQSISTYYHHIIQKNLQLYNLTNLTDYNINIANDIIFNEHKHLVCVFKDHLILNESFEFILSYYPLFDSLKSLIQFPIKPIHPRFNDFTVQKILLSNKNKMKSTRNPPKKYEINIQQFENIVKKEDISITESKESLRTLKLDCIDNNNFIEVKGCKDFVDINDISFINQLNNTNNNDGKGKFKFVKNNKFTSCINSYKKNVKQKTKLKENKKASYLLTSYCTTFNATTTCSLNNNGTNNNFGNNNNYSNMKLFKDKYKFSNTAHRDKSNNNSNSINIIDRFKIINLKNDNNIKKNNNKFISKSNNKNKYKTTYYPKNNINKIQEFPRLASSTNKFKSNISIEKINIKFRKTFNSNSEKNIILKTENKMNFTPNKNKYKFINSKKYIPNINIDIQNSNNKNKVNSNTKLNNKKPFALTSYKKDILSINITNSNNKENINTINTINNIDNICIKKKLFHNNNIDKKCNKESSNKIIRLPLRDITNKKSNNNINNIIKGNNLPNNNHKICGKYKAINIGINHNRLKCGLH